MQTPELSSSSPLLSPAGPLTLVEGLILKKTSEFIILCHKQQVLVHSIDGMQHRCKMLSLRSTKRQELPAAMFVHNPQRKLRFCFIL